MGGEKEGPTIFYRRDQQQRQQLLVLLHSVPRNWQNVSLNLHNKHKSICKMQLNALNRQQQRIHSSVHSLAPDQWPTTTTAEYNLIDLPNPCSAVTVCPFGLSLSTFWHRQSLPIGMPRCIFLPLYCPTDFDCWMTLSLLLPLISIPFKTTYRVH